MKAIHHIDRDPYNNSPENLRVMEMTDVLTPVQIQTLSRLMWGDRFSIGSEELGEFLGIRHRAANRLLAGEMRANPGISAELVAEFRNWLLRSDAEGAKLIRMVLEPHHA